MRARLKVRGRQLAAQQNTQVFLLRLQPESLTEEEEMKCDNKLNATHVYDCSQERNIVNKLKNTRIAEIKCARESEPLRSQRVVEADVFLFCLLVLSVRKYSSRNNSSRSCIDRARRRSTSRFDLGRSSRWP